MEDCWDLWLKLAVLADECDTFMQIINLNPDTTPQEREQAEAYKANADRRLRTVEFHLTNMH